jgi:acid stress-induced BolA-like protein IbaG/YrbA
MFFAEQALFDGMRPVVRNNLYYASLADATIGTADILGITAGFTWPAKWYAR